MCKNDNNFSELGYKAVEMTDEHLNAMREFYTKHRNERRSENWNSKGQTAVNGHEVEPSMVSLDLDMQFRDMIVNRYVKPVLEEWVGFPLKLTSHYGIRLVYILSIIFICYVFCLCFYCYF